MDPSSNFLYEFKVGMTCSGCSNAIKRILDQQPNIVSFETSVPDKKLTVIGADGIDLVIMEKLTKWANAAKKDLEYVGNTELVAAQ